MGFVEYLVSKTVGPDKIRLLRYNNDAKADKMMEVLAIPQVVIADAHTAAVEVGKGNLCRVFGTAGTDLVTFGANSSVTTPTSTTQNAAMLSQSCQIFVATDNFIRTSTGVTRIEVFQD